MDLARKATTTSAASDLAAARRRATSLPAAAVALVDLILINVGFGVAWFLRYRLQLGREVAAADFLPLTDYWGIEFILTVSLLLIYYINGVYGRRRRQGWVDEVSGIAQGALLGIAVMIVVVFYLRPFGYSRLVFIFALLSIVALLAAARATERTWQGHLRRHGIGLRRVLIVGEGPLGRLIMQNVVAQPELGLQVVGFVDDEPRPSIGRLQYLGRCVDVSRLVRELEVDEVLIALPTGSHRLISEILMACARQLVRFRIVPDFFELSLNQVDVTEINGIPLIGLRESTLRGGGRLIKRALDVVVAAFCLVFLSPLMLAIAIAIKLDSSGPIFVEQIRVGRSGQNFKFFKFRSMHDRADLELVKLLDQNEVDGPIFKMKNDPRRTRVGRWIRRFSLDELPQMLNVLRGDMSLIGPRPPFPHEVESYQDWHRRRLEVSPGITGLWQVSGRSELPFDEMALLDIWYIENWSLGLDLKIMLRTIPTVVFGYGAY
jgi:exopolysaccharide biosynthesis polyprenyl glycosylphosphotransferase